VVAESSCPCGRDADDEVAEEPLDPRLPGRRRVRRTCSQESTNSAPLKGLPLSLVDSWDEQH
jgi:hypothetical protein